MRSRRHLSENSTRALTADATPRQRTFLSSRMFSFSDEALFAVQMARELFAFPLGLVSFRLLECARAWKEA